MLHYMLTLYVVVGSNMLPARYASTWVHAQLPRAYFSLGPDPPDSILWPMFDRRNLFSGQTCRAAAPGSRLYLDPRGRSLNPGWSLGPGFDQSRRVSAALGEGPPPGRGPAGFCIGQMAGPRFNNCGRTGSRSKRRVAAVGRSPTGHSGEGACASGPILSLAYRVGVSDYSIARAHAQVGLHSSVLILHYGMHYRGGLAIYISHVCRHCWSFNGLLSSLVVRALLVIRLVLCLCRGRR